MDSELVKSEVVDGIGKITLNRPAKRNALLRATLENVEELARHFSQDPSVRMILLQSTGSVFCAGMDLDEMRQRNESAEPILEWNQDAYWYAQATLRLFDAGVPTVAKVQGPVVAGGVGLVLACDFIVASENATLQLPEPKRGIVAAMVTPFLSYRTSVGFATDLLISGEAMKSDRALQAGLFHRVTTSDKLDAETDSLCKSILTGAPQALRATKRGLRKSKNAGVVDQVLEATRISAKFRGLSEAQEGLAAFEEKRQPSWVVGASHNG